jgi:membrane protein implicated in regulation of membrane protease activity
MFNLVTGVVLLFASAVAGALWDAFGYQWTFLAGAVFALLTVLGLLPLRTRVGRRNRTGPAA